MLIRLMLPGMLKRESRSGIINVSSYLADLPLPVTATYAASKKFNQNLSFALSTELEWKIDVMCLKPLLFSTKLNGMKAKTGVVLKAN